MDLTNIDPNATTDFVPRVKDLFYGCVGIEELDLPEVLEPEIYGPPRLLRLFRPNAYPWEALDELDLFMTALCKRFDPRILEEKHYDAAMGEMVEGRGTADNRRRSIIVKQNMTHLYPCIRDACKYIAFGAVLDWQAEKQRGGRDCVIDGSVSLAGRVFLGDKVQLRDNSAIIGPAVIGDDRTFNDDVFDPKKQVGIGGVIGDGVKVKRSIVRDGAYISSGTVVKHSIIGQDTVMDPGATILYKRFDREEIVIRRLDRKRQVEFNTGRPRLGVFIGDECKVGSIKMHPGVILMPGCQVPTRIGELRAGVYTPEFFKRKPKNTKKDKQKKTDAT